MRAMNRYGISALLLAASLAACSGYDKNAVQDITAPLAGSYIRFANFSVSAPGVNFYANTTKMTAVGATTCSPPPTVPNPACTTTGLESTTGTASGAFAQSATGLYSEIAPGQYTFTSKIAATTDKDLIVSTVAQTIENGKYYTFYNSGTYDGTAKKTDAFIVEDPIPAAFDYSQAYVRYVNAVSTAAPQILYAKNQTTSTEVALGGAVAYKTAGAFTALPPGVYDLSTRTAGSSTNIYTRTGVTFAAGRVYTITARATSATAATLDNTANR